METDQLIDQLSGKVQRTGHLSPPLLRTAAWFAMTIPYAIVIVLIQPLPFDQWKIADVRFVIEQIAALATAVTSANAAFSSVIPGYDRKILLQPLIPLAIWLAVLGEGCLHDWRQLGSDGLILRDDWGCLPLALAISVVPAIAIVIMLRRGAPLIPHFSLALASMAVVAFANFTMRLHHYGDVSIMILVWHFGAVLFFTLIAGVLGPHFLNWRRVRPVG